jgi:hypothetical protein
MTLDANSLRWVCVLADRICRFDGVEIENVKKTTLKSSPPIAPTTVEHSMGKCHVTRFP